jgi:hypothetical protein
MGVREAGVQLARRAPASSFVLCIYCIPEKHTCQALNGLAVKTF